MSDQFSAHSLFADMQFHPAARQFSGRKSQGRRGKVGTADGVGDGFSRGGEAPSEGGAGVASSPFIELSNGQTMAMHSASGSRTGSGLRCCGRSKRCPDDGLKFRLAREGKI
jgi:hypothetical protein